MAKIITPIQKKMNRTGFDQIIEVGLIKILKVKKPVISKPADSEKVTPDPSQMQQIEAGREIRNITD